jgi:regulator of sigma E protease
MTLIIFIIVLSILILAHELGHFVVSKRNGIRVEEFGLGLPPKIIGKKFGETTYTLNLLPFGGFNRLTGEDDGAGKTKSDPKSFASKTPWVRSKVLVAGVIMNVLLAVTLYYTFFFFHGFETFNIPLFFDHEFAFGQVTTVDTVISGFSEDAAIVGSGVHEGDAVLEINGIGVSDVEGVRGTLADVYASEVTLLVRDMSIEGGGESREVVVPLSVSDEGTPVLGVFLTSSASISYEKPLERVFSGFLHAYNMQMYSLRALGGIFGLSIRTRDITPVSQSISGPVGIYSVVGNIIGSSAGAGLVALTLIDFMAFMSLSLAFLNILPLPALDGGRLIFVLAEWVRGGKRLNPSIESGIHGLGMILLLGLLVLISIKDILL